MTGLDLFMVGVVVSDMRRALEFYRRLGIAVPADSDDVAHVEVKMSGLTFFLTTEEGNARWDPARRPITGDGYRIVLEFYLGTAEELDARYAELTGYGYTGHCAPYDVTADTRFAIVEDPDGNAILLSSTTASEASAA